MVLGLWFCQDVSLIERSEVEYREHRSVADHVRTVFVFDFLKNPVLRMLRETKMTLYHMSQINVELG